MPDQENRSQDISHERSLIEAARKGAAHWRGCPRVRGSEPFQLGEQPLDGYDLLHEIHRGGQGVVYKALQRSTCRHVAIKVMLHGPLAAQSARVRFQREVRLIAALRHPNIVVIHDSGAVHGYPYFVMDFIPGQSIVEYCRTEEPAAVRTMGVVRQMIDAVSFAHLQGVIHRDLKPSNVLVSDNGIAYVLDFGLATTAGGFLGPSLAGTLSQPGEMLGTAIYMAPEQTRGKPELMDARTDVHALGVIIYEVLSGSHPFVVVGDISGTIQRIRDYGPPNLAGSRSGIDAELGAILVKALQKEPTARYSSATEMLLDVDRWLEINREGNARCRPTMPTRVHQIRRFPALALGAFAAIVLMATGTHLYSRSRQQASHAIFIAPIQDDSGPRESPASPSTRNRKPSGAGLLTRLRQDLPIRSLRVEPASSPERVRITGWLLNHAELDVLHSRLREVRESVDIEAQVNPEQVRVLVERSLLEVAGESIRVRLEGKKGSERLAIEMRLADDQPGVEARAKSFVFDASAVTFRAYREVDPPGSPTEIHTRPAPQDRQ